MNVKLTVLEGQGLREDYSSQHMGQSFHIAEVWKLTLNDILPFVKDNRQYISESVHSCFYIHLIILSFLWVLSYFFPSLINLSSSLISYVFFHPFILCSSIIPFSFPSCVLPLLFVSISPSFRYFSFFPHIQFPRIFLPSFSNLYFFFYFTSFLSLIPPVFLFSLFPVFFLPFLIPFFLCSMCFW